MQTNNLNGNALTADSGTMTEHKFPWKWNLTDLANVKKNGCTVFSCFSCGGGSSMGYKLAGYELLGNCEIDSSVMKVYQANHHPKYPFLMDIRDFLDKEKPAELYDLDILDGSPPCFAAGTMVRTRDGYKPIESIQVGDEVMTHKGRYRRVKMTMSKYADNVCTVLFQDGTVLTVTENHPFLQYDMKNKEIWKPIGEYTIEDNAVLVNGDNTYTDIKFLLREKVLPQIVYNLSVEEDESYTVSDIAVHNCSVFSRAGKREEGWNIEKQFREGQKMQRLDDLFFWFIKLIDQLKPKVSIAENVTGLLAGNAKGYVNEIIKAYHEAGYTVQLFKLNAAKMGVPQRRERVFFIAHRNDIDLPKLQLSFNEPPILFKEIRSESGKEWANENAISKMRLMVRKPGDKDISSIMKSNNQRETSFQYGVIADNDVAPTLAASGSMARMYDGKNISDTDIIHMQTFPEDYNFLNQSPKYICGMSVPPVMMAQISSQVYNQWLRRLK